MLLWQLCDWPWGRLVEKKERKTVGFSQYSTAFTKPLLLILWPERLDFVSLVVYVHCAVSLFGLPFGQSRNTQVERKT